MLHDQFPIMSEQHGPKLGYIPMALIRLHSIQAGRNHGGQTVERLRDRGGLSAQEAMAVINDTAWEDRRWTTEATAWANLQILVDAEYSESFTSPDNADDSGRERREPHDGATPGDFQIGDGQNAEDQQKDAE